MFPSALFVPIRSAVEGMFAPHGFTQSGGTVQRMLDLFRNYSTLIIAVIAAAAALASSYQTAQVSRLAADRAFAAKMVEIGVNILSTDPGKSDVTAARQWAIDLVVSNSGQPFNDEARAKLLHNSIIAPGALSGTIAGGGALSGTLSVDPPK